MITDGVFALPDASAVDSLLAQLRASTVCCSFIKIGSGFHAHCRYVKAWIPLVQCVVLEGTGNSLGRKGSQRPKKLKKLTFL